MQKYLDFFTYYMLRESNRELKEKKNKIKLDVKKTVDSFSKFVTSLKNTNISQQLGWQNISYIFEEIPFSDISSNQAEIILKDSTWKTNKNHILWYSSNGVEIPYLLITNTDQLKYFPILNINEKYIIFYNSMSNSEFQYQLFEPCNPNYYVNSFGDNNPIIIQKGTYRTTLNFLSKKELENFNRIINKKVNVGKKEENPDIVIGMSIGQARTAAQIYETELAKTLNVQAISYKLNKNILEDIKDTIGNKIKSLKTSDDIKNQFNKVSEEGGRLLETYKGSLYLCRLSFLNIKKETNESNIVREAKKVIQNSDVSVGSNKSEIILSLDISINPKIKEEVLGNLEKGYSEILENIEDIKNISNASIEEEKIKEIFDLYTSYLLSPFNVKDNKNTLETIENIKNELANKLNKHPKKIKENGIIYNLNFDLGLRGTVKIIGKNTLLLSSIVGTNAGKMSKSTIFSNAVGAVLDASSNSRGSQLKRSNREVKVGY